MDNKEPDKKSPIEDSKVKYVIGNIILILMFIALAGLLIVDLYIANVTN